MTGNTKLYGLVVSGGKSIRMGCDKAMLVYHKRPQRYHAYDLLMKVCNHVFISCNEEQLAGIDKSYTALADHPEYRMSGPMAALLTAFAKHPGYDLLVMGCDYPFVKAKDINDFYSSIQVQNVAAAFYNFHQHLYEPLIAWYSSKTAPLLQEQFKMKNYSLQYFLEKNKAHKYYPADENTLTSIDTPEAFAAARLYLKKHPIRD